MGHKIQMFILNHSGDRVGICLCLISTMVTIAIIYGIASLF